MFLLRLVLLNVETKFLNLIKCDFNSFDDKSILLELVKFSTEDKFNCYNLPVVVRKHGKNHLFGCAVKYFQHFSGGLGKEIGKNLQISAFSNT